MVKHPVVIWHNPRCSKSRQTLQLLRQKGIKPEIIEYLQAPPSAEEIRSTAHKLGGTVFQMLRTKEDIFKSLNLSSDMPDATLAHHMTQHPKLIERPVVIASDKAAIGRPPENVLDILPED